MKILMILENDFPPDPRVENEIDILHKNGFKVLVACYTRKDKIGLEKTRKATIYRKAISNFRYKSSVGALRSNYYFAFWTRFIRSIIKKHGDIDVLHVHDITLFKPMQQLAKKHGLKIVLDNHENYPYLLQESPHTQGFLGRILSKHESWKAYEKYAVKNADRVLCVVDEMKNRLVSLGAKSENVFVYQNVVNLSQFNIPPKKNFRDTGAAKFIYVGGVSKHRGLGSIIRAFTVLVKSNPKCTLDIVGSGRALPEIKQMVHDLKITKKVIFHGWKDFKDVPSLLVKADVALIPHKKTIQTDCSSPNKLYQYMALGLPIITSNIDSVARIIKEYNLGLEYTWGNQESLTSAMIDLANMTAEEKMQLGANGINLVKDQFNHNIEGKNILKMYESLSNER